jgi:hypothetical protein
MSARNAHHDYMAIFVIFNYQGKIYFSATFIIITVSKNGIRILKVILIIDLGFN